MRHGVDEYAQIGSDGAVVGEVPGDNGEDGPMMKMMSRLVRCRCRRVSYVACNLRIGVPYTGQQLIVSYGLLVSWPWACIYIYIYTTYKRANIFFSKTTP
jgi:hypothetical protein